MNETSPLSPRDPGLPAGPAWRDTVSSALRYWERRRPAYNLVLVGLVIYWVVVTWPHFRPALNLPSLAKMLVLAALANVCYCASYPVDFALQSSPSPGLLRRGRAMLWWAGMIFAFVLAYYWIGDEIYPDFK